MQTINDGVDLRALICQSTDDEYLAAIHAYTALAVGEDGGRFEPVLVRCGGPAEEMAAGRVLANLVLLYAYRVAGAAPPPERFVRGRLDSAALDAHLNETTTTLYEVADPAELSEALAFTLATLTTLSTTVTTRVGTSVSIRELFEAAERDPKIWGLLNYEIPTSMSFEEIERDIEEAGSDLQRRLAALPGAYGRLLNSGAAVNKDQLRQAFLCVGPKPSLEDGKVIPEPIATSFLRGMRTAEEMLVCAIGARKALVTNYRQVRDSGYMARKLVLLVAGHTVDPALEDCGTQHGLEVRIQSADHAARLERRWVLEEDGSRPIPAAELQARVGEMITLRSPVTCAAPGGVCRRCYGDLVRLNHDIHAGIYGVLVISEQLTQRLLSSKHLLKTRAAKVRWPAEFLKSFSVDKAVIVPESTVDRIFIKLEDLTDEEGDGEEARATTTFSYRTTANRRQRFVVQSPIPVILDPEAWDQADTRDGELSIEPAVDAPAFSISVNNTELSAALFEIIGLIESHDEADYNELYHNLADLLTRSEIRTPSIHAEMIIRALVRDGDTPTLRPDFSRPEAPPYVLLRLKPAILSGPSVTNSLAFERVKSQLTSAEIFTKSERGLLDALFGG